MERLKPQRDVTTAEKFVRENKELLVTRADMSNATVILQKKDFDEKMYALLTYKPIKRHPHASCKPKIIIWLKKCSSQRTPYPIQYCRFHVVSYL